MEEDDDDDACSVLNSNASSECRSWVMRPSSRKSRTFPSSLSSATETSRSFPSPPRNDDDDDDDDDSKVGTACCFWQDHYDTPATAATAGAAAERAVNNRVNGRAQPLQRRRRRRRPYRMYKALCNIKSAAQLFHSLVITDPTTTTTTMVAVGGEWELNRVLSERSDTIRHST